MKIKNRLVQEIISMAESFPGAYDGRNAVLSVADHVRFGTAFKSISKELSLKTRLKVSDVQRFCDALQTIIVLE